MREVVVALARTQVRVAVAPADAVVRSWGAAGPASLGAPERERWTALRDTAARRDYLASHLLVRSLAAAALGVRAADVALTQVCDRCGGPHGRPRLPHDDLHVSLTRADGWVGAAVAPVRVGVDLEPVAAFGRGAAGEGREPRPWVRREAAVKAGGGSLDELVALPAGPSGPTRRVRVGPVLAADVVAAAVPDELVVAVAVTRAGWIGRGRAGSGQAGRSRKTGMSRSVRSSYFA